MDKRKIILVDDDHDLVTVVKAELESMEYHVQCAFGCEGMFKLLEDEKPDLIILDIMMPQMNGLDALVRLKGAGKTSSIPVILLTAKDKYEDILHGYQLGADYYISEPFTRTQLVQGINLLLGGRNTSPSPSL